MPEFGGWMIEAVPSEPYLSLMDANNLLSCENKITYRRQVLETFLKPHNIVLLSLTNAITLGMKHSMYIDDESVRGFVRDNVDNLPAINSHS
jgi:hypothetical protein